MWWKNILQKVKMAEILREWKHSSAVVMWIGTILRIVETE